MLEVDAVSKSFGGRLVLDSVSFRVAAGTAVGIVGPNGCGKSTLLNIIGGFVAPTTGTVRLAGCLLKRPPLWRLSQRIARSFQDARGWPNHTPLQQLEFISAEADLGNAALKAVGLGHMSHRRQCEMSFGQRKRLDLARLSSRAPADLYLLDEPTAGLPPEFLPQLQTFITSQLQRGASVIIVEHNLTALAQLVSQIVLLDAGTVRAVGATEAIIQGIARRSAAREHHANG